MNVWLVLALVTMAAPVMWVLGLGMLHLIRRQLERRRVRRKLRPSALEIISRVEAERVAEGKSGRYWPKPDIDDEGSYPVAGYVPRVYRLREADEPAFQRERPAD